METDLSARSPVEGYVHAYQRQRCGGYPANSANVRRRPGRRRAEAGVAPGTIKPRRLRHTGSTKRDRAARSADGALGARQLR